MCIRYRRNYTSMLNSVDMFLPVSDAVRYRIAFKRFVMTYRGYIERDVLYRGKPLPRDIVISFPGALGDCVLLTAIIKSLKEAYSNLSISLQVHFPEIFENNPYIKNVYAFRDKGLQGEVVKIDFSPLFSPAALPEYSFLEALYRIVEKAIGLSIPRLRFPDIHLASDEIERFKAKFQLPAAYWIINSGYKPTNPLKFYRHFQRVIDELPDIQFIQVGDTESGRHKPLSNCINLIDRTSIRELLILCSVSSGILSPITAVMHLGAAFDKPCVTIAGHRESRGFIQYPYNNHRIIEGGFICEYKGCNLYTGCKYETGQGYAECVCSIEPDIIVEAIRNML